MGLAEHFTVFTCGQDLGVRKPDPEIFRRSCAAVQAAPAACLYVGNDWALDVEGAQKAGLRPVWIPTSADRVAAGDDASPDVPVFADVCAFAEAFVAAADHEAFDE